jgi:integrase
LHPIAIEIIQIYSNDGSKYLLPILPNFKQSPVQLKKTSLDKLKQMNKALKNLSKVAEIDESISTYTSRYSWANIAKEIGTPKEVIAEALGHSYGNAVTGIYLDGFDKKVMDKANVDVIQAVLGDGIGKIK